MRRGRGSVRARRAGIAALLATVAVLLLGPAQTAQAHAFLNASNPADGEVLEVAPTSLRLTFSESVVRDATHIDVVDGDGVHHAPTGLHVESSAAADTEQPMVLVAALPSLPRNTYRVTWSTLSSDDLHVTSGVLAFGIGEAVAATGTIDEAPGPSEALARWLLWLGLAGMLGPVVLALVVARAGGSLPTPRRARLVRLARWSSLWLVVAAVLLPAAQLRSVSAAWQAAHAVDIGVGWGGRVVAAVVAALLAGAVVRQPLQGKGSRLRLALLTAAAATVPLLSAWRGHLGSTGSSLLIAADVVHSASAAGWVGAVAALAIVHAGRSGPRAVVPSRPFAAVSAGCVALLVASGVVLAGHGVATVTALAHALYGRVVLLKVGLLGAVLVLALANHLRGRRDGTVGQRGRVWVSAESGLLVVLLGLAGVLAATAPANSPQWTPAPAASRLVSTRAADLVVELSVAPNRPGDAFATVNVLQTRLPAPAPITSVMVRWSRAGDVVGPVGATLQPGGAWTTPVQLTAAGPWQVTVTAARPGLAPITTTVDWVVGGGVHGPPGRSLGALSWWLAAAVLLLWVVALVVRPWGGRPAPLPHPVHHPSTRSAPPDPASEPGTTNASPPRVVPTDAAVDCVPPQPTDQPVPPVSLVPPGGSVGDGTSAIEPAPAAAPAWGRRSPPGGRGPRARAALRR